MSKLDDIVSLLKEMPAETQEIAADALLDFMADDRTLQLNPQQVAKVDRRARDTGAASLTLDELRARVRKLTA